MEINGKFSFESMLPKESIQDPRELFARGEFTKMHEILGQQNPAHELYTTLHTLRIIKGEGVAPKMPPGHLSRRFLDSEPESLEHYEMLFLILKEMGFTDADRPEMERYFEAVREANETPHPGEDPASERLTRLQQSLANAASALDTTFPRNE